MRSGNRGGAGFSACHAGIRTGVRVEDQYWPGWRRNWLRAGLLDAALLHDATESDGDEYGQRYIMDFDCARIDLRATIRSGWNVRRGESFPRLTTCYVLSE